MKTIKLLILIAIVTLQALSVQAAGTLTLKGFIGIGNNVSMCHLVYTDDTAGIDTTFEIPGGLMGWQPGAVLHDPGATAMTATADITITWGGADVFDGGLLDCGGTSNTHANYALIAPAISTYGFTLSGNSVNNATGDVYIFFYK